jgi:DivIVA domain-containing protein
VELERSAIERKDFPASRRGYDTDEVDAHLKRVADAVEELRQSSTAGLAAKRVRAIVEAAERSAAEIESSARDEADASRGRAQAEAAESLRRAHEAESLLEKAGAEMERLKGALATLRTTLETPADSDEGEGSAERERTSEPAQGDAGKAATAHAEPQAGKPVQEAQESQAEAAEKAAPPTPPRRGRRGKRNGGEKPGRDKQDTEGARLIALNMALNGTPREETERYLSENFELNDAKALLDEVYSG